MKRDLIMTVILLAVALTLGMLGSKSTTNPLAEVRQKVLVTKPGKFPAMVRLVDMSGRTMCSGTVIAKDLVLTAAHCIQGPTVVRSELRDDGQTQFVPSLPIVYQPRADYAILSGDFSDFDVMSTETDPEKDLLYNQTDLVSCGFPWGDTAACYPILTQVKKMYEGFQAEGQMYPAMSGGPVIDTRTGKVVGVNHGIGDNKVIFMPILGIYKRLEEYQSGL